MGPNQENPILPLGGNISLSPVSAPTFDPPIQPPLNQPQNFTPRPAAPNFPTVSDTIAVPQTIATAPQIISSEVAASSKKGHLLRNALLLFLLLILSSASFLGLGLFSSYSNYKNIPLPKALQSTFNTIVLSSFLPKPDSLIFSQMANKMSQLETCQHQTDLSMIVTNSGKKMNFDVSISGPLDFRTQKVSRSEAKMSVKTETDGMSVTIGGELRVIEDILYFKLTQFPDFFSDGQDFKDQWFFLDLKDSTQKEEPKIKFYKTEKYFKEEILAKFQNWAKHLPDEAGFYHFDVTPPPEVTDGLVTTFYQELLESSSNNDIVNQAELDNDLKKIKSIFTKIGNSLTIEIYINKNTFYVEKVESKLNKFDLDFPSNTQGISTLQVNHPTLDIEQKTTLSAFNAPIIIEIPQGAKDAQKIFGDVIKPEIGASLSASPSASPSAGFEKSPVLGINTNQNFNLLKRFYFGK